LEKENPLLVSGLLKNIIACKINTWKKYLNNNKKNK